MSKENISLASAAYLKRIQTALAKAYKQSQELD